MTNKKSFCEKCTKFVEKNRSSYEIVNKVILSNSYKKINFKNPSQ